MFSSENGFRKGEAVIGMDEFTREENLPHRIAC
jgi:hypothetical protein